MILFVLLGIILVSIIMEKQNTMLRVISMNNQVIL